MPQAGKINLVIPNHLDNVWTVGVAIRALCSQAGMGEDTASLIELAVVEAVNNCIEHAYRDQTGHSVEIDVELSENEALFQIYDEGEHLAALPETTLEFNAEVVSSLPEGGMGLYIIKQVMDRVEYSFSEGKNRLILIKFLDRL